MSSIAWTARAVLSASAFDNAFTVTTSEAGEATVRFGDGAHGATPSLGASPTLEAAYAAGAGASGNVARGTTLHSEGRLPVRSNLGDVEFSDQGRHFSGIVMQQGRVQTDADCHEAAQVDWWRDPRLLEWCGRLDVVTPDTGSDASDGSGSDDRP